MLVVLVSATSVSSQVLNGTFDSWTGNLPNDWTVSSQAQSFQLKDTLTKDPYIQVHAPYFYADGLNLILLSDTTAAHPYGALLDPTVKRLTFKYALNGIYLSTVTKVTYLLRDHTGFIYAINQKQLKTYGGWNTEEFGIITTHRDLTGPNYIEIRFTSVTVGKATANDPVATEFNFFLDDVALDTNASLSVSKPNSLASSLTVTPNPASSQTTINVVPSSPEAITTTIYSLIGTEVKRIVSSVGDASGVIVETSDLPNGVYFVRSNVGNSILSQKLVVAH